MLMMGGVEVTKLDSIRITIKNVMGILIIFIKKLKIKAF